QQNEVANKNLEQGVSGFRIRRARLNAKTELSDVFSVDSWFEFSDKDNILLDFKALAKIAPELNVTVGQFTTPTQSYETSRLSSSAILFYELSDVAIQLSNNMGLSSYRDVGIMVGGKYEMVTYALYMGNGTGRFNYSGTSISNRTLGDGLMGGRVDVEIAKGLTIGGHYGMNKQDSAAGTAYSPTPRSYDRESYSGNVVLEGFGLADLYAYGAVCAGKVNESKTDYDGIVAAVGYKVLPDLQLLARYDTYNSKVGTATTQKRENITVGGLYYFFREKTEIVRLGLDYELRKESPKDLKNNVVVLWAQFKF
ncbi:MAG TPA: porin, partial [Bacteroidota bacterium]|nr:porin [Bacteroidota bacterium]